MAVTTRGPFKMVKLRDLEHATLLALVANTRDSLSEEKCLERAVWCGPMGISMKGNGKITEDMVTFFLIII